jgi:hypothetical protein
MRGFRQVGPASRGRCAGLWIVTLAMLLGGCVAPGQLAPGAIDCDGSSAPGRWMLQPGGVLQGVVADTRGKPIVGAVVHMRPVGADSASAPREAGTASHGAFALDAIAPGRYVAHAAAPAHGTWTGTVELAEDQGTIPRIQLCTGR